MLWPAGPSAENVKKLQAASPGATWQLQFLLLRNASSFFHRETVGSMQSFRNRDPPPCTLYCKTAAIHLEPHIHEHTLNDTHLIF